jgi:hypothetical protein
MARQERRRRLSAASCIAAILALVVTVALPHAQDVRRELRVPDPPGFVTLKADLHLHSVFSDGEVWPTVHVREAWRDGLDAIALTEHREYRPHAADLAGGAMRAYEVARPLAEQLGIVLIPGVEITRPAPGQPSPWPHGSAHFNALWAEDDQPLDAPDLAGALGIARAQGAFVTWNHPAFMDRPAQWFAHVDEVFRKGLFRGIEIVNGDQYSPEAFGWALERKLTILACSDAHLPMPAHLRSARRPVTLLFARTRDAAGVREALEAGRTAAWLDDDVWGEEEWVRAIWDGGVRWPRVDVRPGEDLVLPLENRTSIDFLLTFGDGPLTFAWPTLRVRAGATTLMRARLSNDAAAGATIEVPAEVRGLHPRPGQGLRVTLRVEPSR